MLNDALKEILKRAPLRLDDAPSAEANLKDSARYADDHEFTISLPAWVFRALKKEAANGLR